MNESRALNRRSFLAASLAAAASSGLHAAPAPKSKYKICALIKFLQTLSYDELAETIARESPESAATEPGNVPAVASVAQPTAVE